MTWPVNPLVTRIVAWTSSVVRTKRNPTVRPLERKDYLWGYGTPLAVAIQPTYGDVVLAEVTLPFNEADVTYTIGYDNGLDPIPMRLMLCCALRLPMSRLSSAF